MLILIPIFSFLLRSMRKMNQAACRIYLHTFVKVKLQRQTIMKWNLSVTAEKTCEFMFGIHMPVMMLTTTNNQQE